VPAPATQRVAFGPFELDRASGELRRNGARVRLTGHALTILTRLLDEPGAVVSREALRQELWGGGTFVDFEQGLNTAVNRLRQVLGDAAERPRYVETVAGHGYRFVAAVESGAAPPTNGTPRPRRAAAAVALGGSLLAAGAFVGAWWVEASRGGLPRPPVIRFVVEPPAGYALEPATTRQGFDLSPDGRQLVFTARGGDGAFAVFRRDLAEPEPSAVPTAGGAHTVFWAPEGDDIVFAVEGSVRRGPVDGGAHHELARTNRRFFSGAVLSRETVMMMASRFETLLVPRSGGEVVPEQETCAWPEPLPGRDLLLCLDFADEPGRNRVRAEHRTTGGKARIVAETNSRVEYAPSTRSAGLGYLVYVRAGNLVARPVDPRTLEPRGETTPLASGVFHLATSGAADFSLSHGGVLAYMPALGRARLARVDRRGRELGRVGPGSSSIYHLGLSPDATRATAAIYDAGFGGPQVWVFDAATGVGARLEDRHSTHAHWSPDASRLAYAAILGTTAPRLVTRSLDGPGAAEYLLPGDREQLLELPTDWSRDGRFVLFEQPLRGDVQVVDLERERRVIPLLHSPASESGAVFSPDGGRIAYLADRSGVPEVYVQRFEAEPVPRVAGEPVRVSRRGARAVRWPDDGSELFYAGIDGWMYAVPIVKTRPGEPEALFEVELEALSSMTRSFSFDVAPGGDRFLVARLERAPPDHIVVIRNWESLLPQ
jgi:DNA-binding winged helix-turn-helix (wHTH) protein/Tol biopolymer transport system component